MSRKLRPMGLIILHHAPFIIIWKVESVNKKGTHRRACHRNLLSRSSGCNFYSKFYQRQFLLSCQIDDGNKMYRVIKLSLEQKKISALNWFWCNLRKPNQENGTLDDIDYGYYDSILLDKVKLLGILEGVNFRKSHSIYDYICNSYGLKPECLMSIWKFFCWLASRRSDYLLLCCLACRTDNNLYSLKTPFFNSATMCNNFIF